MGSVKDLEIVKNPTPNNMGIGRFVFSDRYSVFDWGEMPDQIKEKGKALCMMGAFFFEKLQNEGVATHYRGLVDGNGKLTTFEEVEEPTNIMEIDVVNVVKPRVKIMGGVEKYDYSIYSHKLKNFLIPLEVIYRNGLPAGSSVFKRLSEGTLSLIDLGLTKYPKSGEELANPIFDVSTKLETKDRYI